jgi:hypothetical protein
VRVPFVGLVVVALTGAFAALVARSGPTLYDHFASNQGPLLPRGGRDQGARYGTEELLAGGVALAAALHVDVGDIALVSAISGIRATVVLGLAGTVATC